MEKSYLIKTELAKSVLMVIKLIQNITQAFMQFPFYTAKNIFNLSYQSAG